MAVSTTRPKPELDGKANGMAIASFVLSLCWLWGLGSLLAVIFAVVSNTQNAAEDRKPHALSMAGGIIGIVGVVGAILITVLIISAAGSAGTSY